MAYRLRDGLSCCILGGRTIFLDVAADRYFCCPSSVDGDLRRIIAGEEVEASEQIDWLIRHRVIRSVTGQQVPIPASACPAASESSIGLDKKWLRAGSLWGLIRDQLHMKRRLGQRRLDDILSELGNIRPDLNQEDRAVALAGARAARITDWWWSRNDRCLVKSLALTRFLFRSGCPASLVIGVRQDPFTAHCWVQHGGLVLNDEIDQVRKFTPIFVL